MNETKHKNIIDGLYQQTFRKEWWFTLNEDNRIRMKVVRWTHAETDDDGNVILDKLNEWERYKRDPFTWNYYLVINKKDLLEPKKVAPRRVRDPERKWMRWDYSKSAFNSFDGWNGGITFGECSGDIITLGCDYAHSWDTDSCYSLKHVLYDARNSAMQALPFMKPNETKQTQQ